MSEKIEYNPSENKRFEISKDVYSKERIKKLKNFYRELKNILGLDIAISLFGSLSKAKQLNNENLNKSDIDFTIYIDEQEFQKKFKNIINKLKLTEDFRQKLILEKKHNHNLMVLKKNIKEGLKPDEFDINIAKNLKFISAKSVIDEWINRKVKDYFPNYNLYRDIDTCFINNDSIHDAIDQVRNSVGTANEEGYKFKLARYFALDVGGGLKKYRQNFLRSLDKYSEQDKNQIWSVVDRTVKEFERNNIILENIAAQYPKTYEDACKFYKIR